jgi:transcriptional regulator with XRE-family HTH domain
MKIGTKIKKLRELKGIPQKFMAGKLKLSLNGYGKIEREQVELTLSKLEIIAEVLNIDIHLILDFDVEVFLNSLKEIKNNNKIIEELKKENSKLWSLFPLRKKSPVKKRRIA